MLKKILSLTGVDMLSKTQQTDTQHEKIEKIRSTIMCYCNTIYIGEKKSVNDCWNAC